MFGVVKRGGNKRIDGGHVLTPRPGQPGPPTSMWDAKPLKFEALGPLPAVLAHPQPVAEMAIRAAVLVREAGQDCRMLRAELLGDAPSLRLRAGQHSAHHGRGKEDGALGHTAHPRR